MTAGCSGYADDDAAYSDDELRSDDELFDAYDSFDAWGHRLCERYDASFPHE